MQAIVGSITVKRLDRIVTYCLILYAGVSCLSIPGANAAIDLAIFFAFFRLLNSREGILWDAWIIKAWFLLFIVMSFSALWAENTVQTARHIWSFLYHSAPLPLCIGFIRTTQDTKRILSALAISVATLSFWTIMQWANGIERPSEFFGSFVLLGAQFSQLLPLFFALICYRFDDFPKRRVVMAGVVVLACVALFFSATRGGALSVVGASMGIALLASRRRPRVLFSLAVFFVVLFFSVWLMIGAWAQAASLQPMLRGISSFESRVYLWQAAWNMFLDYPLLGVGPGNFYTLYEARYVQPYAIDKSAAHAHNAIMTILAEYGLLGLSATMVLFVAILRPLWQRFRDLEEPLALVGLAASFGYILISQSDYYFTVFASASQLFWFLIGLTRHSKLLPPTIPKIYVDVSEYAMVGGNTGIQRVTRFILKELLTLPPKGYQVVPVVAKRQGLGYREEPGFVDRIQKQMPIPLIRNKLARHLLSCVFDLLIPAIDQNPKMTGTLFLGLDLDQTGVLRQKRFLENISARGCKLIFILYDLLPIRFPGAFPKPVHGLHKQWLQTIVQFDATICISRSVAEEFKEWLSREPVNANSQHRIGWFHLGTDSFVLSKGSDSAGIGLDIVEAMNNGINILMIGTLEPRKGHKQVIDAFEELWRSEKQLNLLIVGKRGWQIDQLADRIKAHPEYGHRLFWLEGLDDRGLHFLYVHSNCLLFASYGEGFGLPLIEAAQQKLPLIVRDIPVFREVAGEHAHYFSGKNAAELTEALRDWLRLYQLNQHPLSEHISWLSWQESAEQLQRVIFNEIVGEETDEPELEASCLEKRS